MDGDELFSVRNAFYLGDYQEAINEAKFVDEKKASVAERDAFVLRSQIGLKNYNAVLSAIDQNASVGFKAIATLAKYLSSHNNRAAVVEEAVHWLSDVHYASDALVQIIAAIIFINDGKYELALRALHSSTAPEAISLSVQALLRMDRLDLAEQTLKTLTSQDDESALSQLSSALVLVSKGSPEALREAASLYKELGQRNEVASPIISVGLSSVYLALREYNEADSLLNEALKKHPNNPDILANYLSLLHATGRGSSDIAQRALDNLNNVAPDHPLAIAARDALASFDRVSSTFAA